MDYIDKSQPNCSSIKNSIFKIHYNGQWATNWWRMGIGKFAQSYYSPQLSLSTCNLPMACHTNINRQF